MSRCSKFAVGLICFLQCGIVLAQHHHGESRQQGHRRSPEAYVVAPTFGYYGIYGQSFAYRFGGPIVYQPFVPQPMQLVSYPYPVSTVPVPNFLPFQTAKSAPSPSSPAARLKSLDLQARGDQRMRESKWPEARLAYLNSVNAAPERAAAHLRLGLSYVVTLRYDSAIREIKRALALDHNLPASPDKLETIFGPDSKAIRASIVSKLGVWVREDQTNSDRLFLYGVILHFNSDPRARETLDAALHTKPVGDLSHITLFLESSQSEADLKGFPKLNNRPDPVLIARPQFDLRFPKAPVPIPGPDGPVPMPDAPVPMPDGP